METMSVPENKETLHAADSMLHPDTYRGQESVILLVLLGEFLTPRLLPGASVQGLAPRLLAGHGKPKSTSLPLPA